MIASKAPAAHRTPTCVRPQGRRGCVRAQALFGWGKKKEDEYDYKKEEREEAFKAQQELLAKRRTGSAITEAEESRSKVKQTMKARKDERKNERDLLAKGIMPETYSKWKPYEKKEDAEGTSGIVVPLLPFGMRKYDEGERFDLRSPYSDMGWVDPDEVDGWSGLKNWSKKLLNFSGRDLDQQGKPILWASDYQKYKDAQSPRKDEEEK